MKSEANFPLQNRQPELELLITKVSSDTEQSYQSISERFNWFQVLELDLDKVITSINNNVKSSLKSMNQQVKNLHQLFAIYLFIKSADF